MLRFAGYKTQNMKNLYKFLLLALLANLNVSAQCGGQTLITLPIRRGTGLPGNFDKSGVLARV